MLLRLLATLLLLPLPLHAASFAYERDVRVPRITGETSVWVTLDPHAALQRGGGLTLVDGSGQSIPYKEQQMTANLLRSAVLDSAPRAAETVPPTRLQDMIDGNPATAFQPVTADEHTFRFHFAQPVAPRHLVFRLSSGWVEHIRVRLGSSEATLHDAFVGTPEGTSIALSGEVASVVAITVRTKEGVLRIAEAELTSPETRVLFRALPGESYTLRYGTTEQVAPLSAEGVFTDSSAVAATLGPVRTIASSGPDSDGDGSPDALDNCLQKPNSDQQDRDGDRLGDACDNAPSFPNSEQTDRDRDGVGDRQDNCPDTPNADQKDTDLDGVGWVCDDDDGDGVQNSRDNCVGFANSDQRDLNNNKRGDACEDDRDSDGVPRTTDNCSTTSNPDQSDEDRDSIGDVCDVCPYHYDPNQIDRDENGIGDVCQNAAEKTARDSDGDGVPDERDLCLFTSDPSQSDGDADRVGDACDNCPELQNTDQWDSNHDGLGDVCTDTDRDGVLDPYDNCAPYANADQRDRDEDGTGDPCDDDDRDGIENARDNCPLDSNSGQGDEDSDGQGNVCDTSDDRWSEQRPWLLYASMAAIVLVLTGLGALILKRSG